MWDLRIRQRLRSRRTKIENKVKQRRRTWFVAAITLIFWAIIAFTIAFIDPDLLKDIIIPGIYLPFFTTLFFALTFTFYLLLLHTRRALLISSAIIIFLFLRLFGLGTIINLILLIGLFASAEYYFFSTVENNKPSFPPKPEAP